MVTRVILSPGTRIECPKCQQTQELYGESWAVPDPETQELYTGYLLLECGHFVSCRVIQKEQTNA